MFVGITRFSLFTPSSTGWHLSKNAKDLESIQEYRNKLFDPMRLDERIDIFFNISLPSLKVMKKNYQYIHVLQISDQLPAIYKEKIYHLSHEYAFLKIQEIDVEGNSNISLFNLIKSNISLNAVKKIIGVFNLDDDDLLAVDFFDKSIKYLNKKFQNHYLSFGYGITALMQGSDVIEFRESYKPKINIGLMKIGVINNRDLSLPESANHALVDKYSPTIIDSREVMYLWVRHFNQDSSNSFNNPDRQLRIILNNFNDFNNIEITEDIVAKFPMINFRPFNKLKEEIILNKVLSSRELYPIPLKVTGSWVFIQVDFELRDVEHIIDPLKVALISFKLNKDIESLKGLSKSLDPEIGFFRYVGAQGLKNSFTMNLNLPEGVNIESISITRWRYKSHLLLKKLVAYKF